jgi:hypothetical protein
VAQIVFDFGNRGSVELNSMSSELAGKGILRKSWRTTLARLSHAPANNVFPRRLFFHMERVLCEQGGCVLN